MVSRNTQVGCGISMMLRLVSRGPKCADCLILTLVSSCKLQPQCPVLSDLVWFSAAAHLLQGFTCSEMLFCTLRPSYQLKAHSPLSSGINKALFSPWIFLPFWRDTLRDVCVGKALQISSFSDWLLLRASLSVSRLS